MTPATLTRAEAAELCRVSVVAFDEHVRPHLPVKRIGRLVFFQRADVEAFLAAPTVPGPPGVVRPPPPQASAFGRGLSDDPRVRQTHERLELKRQRLAAKRSSDPKSPRG